MKAGDSFTIEGCYRRRTWREWLRRQPRVLQVFHVSDVVLSDPTFQPYPILPSLFIAHDAKALARGLSRRES